MAYSFVLLLSVLIMVSPPNDALAQGLPDSPVFYSTDEFQVTEYDLRMYLRNTPTTNGGAFGSRARVLQALSDLYALELLSRDATSKVTLSDQDRAWIAEYEIKMELATAYLRTAVDERIAATDWETEALEYYLGNREEFIEPESLTVRALLLKTECCDEDAALQLARELIADVKSDSDFETIVRENTEDDVARDDGGLISNMRRGQMVMPFEEAEFALSELGEMTEPFPSQYGIHVIRLLERRPKKQLSFDSVRDQIIADLKPIRRSQYRSAMQQEARERQPSGFTEHTQALDQLLLQTSDGPLQLPVVPE